MTPAGAEGCGASARGASAAVKKESSAPEPDAPRGAVDEARPGLALEGGDLLGHGGLGVGQRLGGGGERAGAGDEGHHPSTSRLQRVIRAPDTGKKRQHIGKFVRQAIEPFYPVAGFHDAGISTPSEHHTNRALVERCHRAGRVGVRCTAVHGQPTQGG